MGFSIYEVLPLVAAMIYTVGSLLMKQALNSNVGAMRVLFLNHWIFFLFMIPAYLTGAGQEDWSLLWAPLLTGVFSAIGALLSILAVKYGDFSVATPLLGMKVLMVAALSAVAGQAVPLSWWVAGILAMVAIFLLGRKPGQSGKSPWLTIGLTAGSCASFAAFDWLFGQYAKDFGFFQYTFWMQVVVVVSSFALIPFFSAPLRQLPKRVYTWVVPSMALMSLQFYLFTWSISEVGDATAANILYASRGMWSVVFVMFIGHWFDIHEAKAGLAVMLERLVGSGLMLAAIAIVMLTGRGA